LGKFFKKAKEFVAERKSMSKLKAMGMTGQTLESIFVIYFWSIDSFINQDYNYWKRQAFKLFVIPGIDDKFNGDAKKKAREILGRAKANAMTDSDLDWLRLELRPYFERGLKDYLDKSFDMLKPMTDDEILSRIKREYKVKKGRYK